MKSIICIIASLFFVQQVSAQAMTTEELAQGVEKMVQDNYQTLESDDLRFVRRNLQEIRIIFANYGISPSSNPEVSRIFHCSADNNPELVRRIVDDSGKALRRDVIKVFSQGYTSEKQAACQAELGQSTLSSNIKGVCRCTQDNSPILYLEMVNSDYQTVGEFFINQFSTGYTSEKRQACEDMRNSLAVCTGI